MGKAEGSQIASVFFGDGDPRAMIDALRTKPEPTRIELRTLAGGITLQVRKDQQGVQPGSRIALVWWDTKQNKAHRSTAAKDNAFNPETDRLLGAVAVLDNQAIRQGKWVPWEERPVLELPPGWPKAERDVLERGQAIGFALAAVGPLAAGDFTAEASQFNVWRSTLEDRIVLWLRKANDKQERVNEKDRVLVRTVYDYETADSRVPIGYRFYAVSASGKLEVQCHCWLHDRKKRLMSAKTERKQFDDN